MLPEARGESASDRERVTMLLDPICDIYEGSSTLEITPAEPSFRFPELSQPT
jgi:hypothetical protein